MKKIHALLGVALAAGLTAFTPAGPARAASCGGSGAPTTRTGKLADGAAYEIQCPATAWNGTLLLYSHGYVNPGTANPATDAGDPVTANWLLRHGFALAGSSYATTGWAIQQALPDQVATLDVFGRTYAKPRRTIPWGHSLGGIITAGLVQDYPDRFSAALPMCGPLSGSVATWNTALDTEFAFQQLLAPSVQVVNITDPGSNEAAAVAAAKTAQQTRRGRARLALTAALYDVPGWFTPLSPEPTPGNVNAQEASQYQWETQADFPFFFGFRAELEARAGGNFSWNTGVSYAADLARSADFREVSRLYRAAGLSLRQDLARLDRAPRISASPRAVRYLLRNIAFTGNLRVPVLTLHTTGDGLVAPEQEQAYRSTVDRAGRGRLLRQLYVHRAGHCAFTPAETITALRALLHRLGTGRWGALAPAALNRGAAALGPAENVYSSLFAPGPPQPAGPRFARFHPPPFLRPFSPGPR